MGVSPNQQGQHHNPGEDKLKSVQPYRQHLAINCSCNGQNMHKILDIYGLCCDMSILEKRSPGWTIFCSRNIKKWCQVNTEAVIHSAYKFI